VVFVILFLITTFVPFFTAVTMNMTTGERFISRFSLAGVLFNCFSVKTFDNIYENFLYKQECSQSLQFFVLLIILDYLLSCLIVWVYDKYKKK